MGKTRPFVINFFLLLRRINMFIKELYERLKPALTTKVTELKRNDLDYIKIEDIWNYLKL